PSRPTRPARCLASQEHPRHRIFQHSKAPGILDLSNRPSSLSVTFIRQFNINCRTIYNILSIMYRYTLLLPASLLPTPGHDNETFTDREDSKGANPCRKSAPRRPPDRKGIVRVDPGQPIVGARGATNAGARRLCQQSA